MTKRAEHGCGRDDSFISLSTALAYFGLAPPNSHTPITKAKVLPFSSPHASQACIAILVSFLQCPLQPNYFHQVTNGEVGAAEDESRGPSVMCPGRKLKLGRDPATES